MYSEKEKEYLYRIYKNKPLRKKLFLRNVGLCKKYQSVISKVMATSGF